MRRAPGIGRVHVVSIAPVWVAILLMSSHRPVAQASALVSLPGLAILVKTTPTPPPGRKAFFLASPDFNEFVNVD